MDSLFPNTPPSALHALLERFVPPGLLTDSAGSVLRVFSLPSEDVLPLPGLPQALREAISSGASAQTLPLSHDGVTESYRLTAEPLLAQPGVAPLYFIAFQPASGRPHLPRLAGDTALELARYAAELERANESLQLHNRHLDEFAYLASHDLKEPLRAILTFSQLLLEDLGGEMPPDAVRDLDHITAAAVRMQRLISDLLTLSRAGRADFHRAPIDLRACVDSALQALAARVHETAAVVTIDPLPSVSGDATLLTQLFQNLLSNAIKYSDPAQPPQIRVTASCSPDGWVFGVLDSGPGIKPEHRDSVFQPFRRHHAAREGTGIGLAICRQVVERHGGRIWVEPAVPSGSHFLFTLEPEPLRRPIP